MIMTGRKGYSGLGTEDNRVFTPGLHFRWQPQIQAQSKPNYAQEWLEETKRLCSIRATNSVLNHVFNGSLVAANAVANRHTSVELANHHVMSPAASAVSSPASLVNDAVQPLNRSSRSEVGMRWPNGSSIDASLPESREAKKSLQFDGEARDGYEEVEHECTAKAAVSDDIEPLNMPSGSEVAIQLPNGSKSDAPLSKICKVKKSPRAASADKPVDGHNDAEHEGTADTTVQPSPAKAPLSEEAKEARKALATIYEKVLVVDTVKEARSVVQLLTTKYKSFIHACDTEVKHETHL
jgi:DNA polymerase-1